MMSVALATDQVNVEDSPGRIETGFAVKLSIRGTWPLAGGGSDGVVVVFGAAGAGGSAVATGAFFEQPAAASNHIALRAAAVSVFLFICIVSCSLLIS